MKKILAAILVLTMLFTLSAAAMADEDEGARTLSWITAQLSRQPRWPTKTRVPELSVGSRPSD